ncbi:hypothetical protein PGT21_011382 [Puccinia graminis f. sp. tritici]|uniref:Uncharacterized protein n=1 Tax=Puccinia graminis f. sp. tritici TaxID=56615 RepID=A0A5B0MJY6_PUCGR|nr:hypothetical protein PGT21_011382 [Puccinia graminis f. sp. tritici]
MQPSITMCKMYLAYVALGCALLANMVFAGALICDKCSNRKLYLTTGPIRTEISCQELRVKIPPCEASVIVERYICKSCGMAAWVPCTACNNRDKSKQHSGLPNYYKLFKCDKCGTAGGLHWTGVTSSYGCGTLQKHSAIQNPNFCRANVVVRQYKCEGESCPWVTLVPMGPCNNDDPEKRHTPEIYYYTP